MRLRCETGCEDSQHSPAFEADVIVAFSWVATLDASGRDCGLIGEVQGEAERNYDVKEALEEIGEKVRCTHCQGAAVDADADTED